MKGVRYCPQCGREIDFEEFNCSSYCSRCGFEYKPLTRINAPSEPEQKPSFAQKAAHAINNTHRFATEKPTAFAVTATGAGAAGVVVGPMAIATGKTVAIAGGVMIGLGLLLNGEERTALIKTGGVVLGGGVALAGAGAALTVAGATTAAAGIGVGTYTAGKGTRKAIGRFREARKRKKNPSRYQIQIKERNPMNTTMTTLGPRLFNPGQTVITPGALDAIAEARQHPGDFLSRHLSGDWGDLCEEDKQTNQDALEHGLRLLSAYRMSSGEKLWIITEADRSATTLLLPSEY